VRFRESMGTQGAQGGAIKSEVPGRTILYLPSPCKYRTVIRGLRVHNLRDVRLRIK